MSWKDENGNVVERDRTGASWSDKEKSKKKEGKGIKKREREKESWARMTSGRETPRCVPTRHVPVYPIGVVLSHRVSVVLEKGAK